MDYQPIFLERLETLKQSHRYRSLQISSGISFVHNDYLNLSQHDSVLAAGAEALQLFGSGSRGSRLLGGQSLLFQNTEERIAEFFGAPASLLFSSGYQANLGAIQVLGECVDQIVSDENNHASLIDGIRLTGKPKHIVHHNGWAEAGEKVPERNSLIVTESLFSMDGDFLDWKSLQGFQQKCEGFLLVDEAHAAGVFGPRGEGYLGEFSIDWNKTAIVVTFGKAFGVSGAAVLGSKPLVELLINRARTFIYTTAPSPAVVAMIGAALDIAEKESWRREELKERASQVRDILGKAEARNGYLPLPPPTSEPEKCSHIVPFLIPGDLNVLRFCENMRDWSLDLRAIRYPTVPKGSERLRISLNLGVSRENSLQMAERVVELWKESSLQEPILG